VFFVGKKTTTIEPSTFHVKIFKPKAKSIYQNTDNRRTPVICHQNLQIKDDPKPYDTERHSQKRLYKHTSYSVSHVKRGAATCRETASRGVRCSDIPDVRETNDDDECAAAAAPGRL